MRLQCIIISLVSMVTTLYTVTAETLPPINPNNLDPGAAHVCQEVQKEAYTQRVSFTQYYTQKTNTWCFSVPPRCTEYRIAARTAYRIDTRYRDRKKYFCCSGYKAIEGHTYCVPECKFDCYEGLEHGYCVTPDKCKCHPGYKGTYCESGCGEDQWGPDCSKTCYCGTHGSCDPVNGNCICHIGYTGQNCSQKCMNSFGLHCVHPCVCENDAICDNINGKCTCQPGFYGAYCHKTCDPSTAEEEGCKQECPCQNGGVCDAVTKDCKCPAGVKGQYCTELCDEFHWGVNCTEKCECNFGKCNRVNGRCKCDHGYAGDTCQIACKEGFYGAGCLTPCGCLNGGKCFRNEDTQMIECNCANTGFHGDICSVRDCPDGNFLVPGSINSCQNCTCEWDNTKSCHPLTGSCSCKPGYTGKSCTEKCSMPFYGQDCSEVCKCANGDCDHVTGECTVCFPGYIGPNCTTPCPDGKWGVDCVNTCTCKNGAKCHVKLGYCECKSGYAGKDCTTYCEEGKYGYGCTGNCTCNTDRSTCSPLTGQCLCHPGFKGEKCEETCDPGTFGYFCLSDCDCSAQGTESCEPKTGFCECKGGWSGKKCDKMCGSSNWGPHCVNKCNCNGNGNCHGETGVCLCYQGYQGDKCEYDTNGVAVVAQQKSEKTETAAAGSTPLIIGIVIPCVLFLIIMALVVTYYMRKVRTLREENLRVRYEANGVVPRETSLPNGNVAIGVENPMYVEDNARNERRYPHLSQRASVAPPPLPHRESCDDIDVEKLRVQMNAGGERPVSSHYADIDDHEDRYTTLKSLSGASNAATAGDSEQIDIIFKSDELDGDDSNLSRSSSTKSNTSGNGSGGFTNKTYVDTNESTPTNFSAQSTDVLSSQPSNVIILDQPSALSSTSSTDNDHLSSGRLAELEQASREYDFPKPTNQTTDLDFSQQGGYINSIPHPPFGNHDTNVELENPYDTPTRAVAAKSEEADVQPVSSTDNNGYLTPNNDVNKTDSKI